MFEVGDIIIKKSPLLLAHLHLYGIIIKTQQEMRTDGCDMETTYSILWLNKKRFISHNIYDGYFTEELEKVV